MLSFDLKWLLFGLLLLLSITAAAAVCFDRWLRSRGQKDRILTAGYTPPILSLFEHMPFALLVLDGPLHCSYANSYASRLLGLTAVPGELPQAAWVELLEEDRNDTRQKGSASYRIVQLQEDKWVRWWVICCDEQALGALELLIVQDATAQRKAELNASLMISDLSHELRTPLATLLTHLEVLRLAQLPPQTRKQSLDLMQSELKRLSRLVNHSIDLSRLEIRSDIELRPLVLLSFVELLITQLAPLAEAKGMTLSLQASEPLPLIYGHKDRLKQLFLNLIDNAIKYSRPGDSIGVALMACDEGIACSVFDSGPGIPAQHLPHITRRFYRVSRVGDKQITGSGLGLALAVEILRRHQSHLEISSHSEGKETGTCMSFVLPTMRGERDE